MRASKPHNRPGPVAPNGASAVPRETIEELRQYDTCAVANAIERFGVRLRNEGFTRPGGLRSMTGDFPHLLGYAATCLIRSSDPPMAGNAYVGRTDWWDHIERLPLPRVAVVQDVEADTAPSGAAVGEVHAAILKALGCAGLITNGAVRDLPAVSAMGFPMFARHAAVSHSYTHIIEYGSPVEIFGLEIRSGELVMADCHGAVTIPHEIAEDLPRVAAEIRASERRIIAVCESPEFSRQELVEAIKRTP